MINKKNHIKKNHKKKNCVITTLKNPSAVILSSGTVATVATRYESVLPCYKKTKKHNTKNKNYMKMKNDK